MPEDESLLDLDYVNACSTTDCTGLLYRPPVNEAEQEWYNEVYEYLPKAISKEVETEER